MRFIAVSMFILSVGFGSESLVLAEPEITTTGKGKVCREVEIDVRTMEGTDRNNTSAPLQVSELKLDSRIKDLAPKLTKLQYRTVRLLSARREIVPLSVKRVVSLSDGHKLTLRPLYVEDKRVGMWMKWNDGAGMDIIDTRMHFSCDENVLTGIEENAEKGLILSIHVTPVLH